MGLTRRFALIKPKKTEKKGKKLHGESSLSAEADFYVVSRGGEDHLPEAGSGKPYHPVHTSKGR
jgi:hypothetical protein